MTLATKITLLRFPAVPLFVGFAIGYVRAQEAGAEAAVWRWAMLATLVIAGLTDVLDGFIARRFNQTSQLGAILDAVADKLLTTTALVTLTLMPWDVRLPLWFAVFMIARDLAIMAGGLVLHQRRGKEMEVRPHWTGKAGTFMVIVCILWVLLQVPAPSVLWPVGLAAALTFVSGTLYLIDARKQMIEHPAEA